MYGHIGFRLNEDLMVKVSDFGLSKSLCKDNYFKLDNKNKELPIKWMSIEAIEYSIFSTKSDVVGFIVIC